jgi:hypothetical protein
MTRTSFSLAVFCCATAMAADTTPLNVKPGEWETTITTESSGQLPIPQEMLDKMPPERRAKMEAAMKQRQGGHTTTSKHCVKKEDLDKAFAKAEENKACTYNILSSSSTKQEIHMECEMGGGKGSGTLKLEAVDSGTVKGNTQMTMSMGPRTMNSNSTFISKWLGACTEANK